MESYDELTSRHEQEIKALADEIKGMLKGVKKSQRAECEARALQMEYDLKAKHREEIDEWENTHGEEAPVYTTAKPSASEDVNKKEAEQANAKKAKAKKKQEKKEFKEKLREEVKKEIEASSSSLGPSPREIENNRINGQLVKEGLCVKIMLSDGHCLYRSVSDQLHLYPDPPTSPILTFQELRQRTAKHLRENREDYAPFLGIEPYSEEFNDYCSNIENEHKAEWGGQVELRALAESLQRRIFVYSADAPVLRMGEETRLAMEKPPLRLSYHKHFYALGEHYNSVVPLEDP